MSRRRKLLDRAIRRLKPKKRGVLHTYTGGVLWIDGVPFDCKWFSYEYSAP